MSPLRPTFDRLAREGRKALVPFVPAGYRDLAETGEILAACVRGGADLIELGVPFGDSLADGPVVQRAYHHALEAGVTLGRVLELVAAFKSGPRPVPVVLMIAYNLVHRTGLEAFGAAVGAHGVDAALVPDLPLEESGPLAAALEPFDVDLIRLIAPTTTPRRAARIARSSRGFLYYISRKGVTGTSSELAGHFALQVPRLKALTRLPVLVGFGISTPDHARTAARVADGVVVGSALIARIDEDGPAATRVEAFVAAMREALSGALEPRPSGRPHRGPPRPADRPDAPPTPGPREDR